MTTSRLLLGLAAGAAALLTTAAPASARALPPVANDDDYVIPIDGELDLAAPGVLANDVDPDSTPIEVITDQVVVDGPALVSLAADGALGVTPAIGFEGYITIAYSIIDGDGGLDGPAIVTVQVGEPGAIPLGYGDEYTVVTGQPLVVDAGAGVLANDTDADGDPLTIDFDLSTIPDFGSLDLAPDGSFVYTPFPDPDPGFAGLDHFFYVATDGTNRTFSVLVELTYVPAQSPAAAPTTTAVPVAAPATTPPSTDAPTVAAASVAAPALPRTGSLEAPLAAVAALLIAAGVLLTASARRVATGRAG